MIAAYIRVSTRQQDYDAQKDAIARAAQARGEAIDLWFEEKVGGASRRRPELAMLLTKARRIDRVYVFRLDRLSRGGIAETLNIVKQLRDSGCSVASVSEPFLSFDGPMGELTLSVLAWAAQQERRALTERLAAARERSLASGGAWGRPTVLLPDTIRLGRELVDAGLSVRRAAAQLGISHSTLGRALQKDPTPERTK
jgi:DNA invertase Pin-like site-specific DNA recombinase